MNVGKIKVDVLQYVQKIINQTYILIGKKGCNKETTIKILPDYCSSSLWCDNCGCEIEIGELGMPNYLALLITYWNLLWDILRTYKTRLNLDYMEKLYKETGNCIEEELSKLYECYFDSKYEAYTKK